MKKFNKKLLFMLFMTLISFGIYQRLCTKNVFATNVETANNQSPQTGELSIQPTQDSDYDKLANIFKNLAEIEPGSLTEYTRNRNEDNFIDNVETVKELLKETKPNSKPGGVQENFTLKNQNNEIVGMISLLRFDLSDSKHAYTNLNIEEGSTPFFFVSNTISTTPELINNTMSNLISNLTQNNGTLFFQFDSPNTTLNNYINLKNERNITDLKVNLPKSEVIEYIKEQKKTKETVSEKDVRNEIKKEVESLKIKNVNTDDTLNKFLITAPEFFEGSYNISVACNKEDNELNSIVKGANKILSDESFIKRRLVDMYFEKGVETIFEKGKKHFNSYVNKILNHK